MPRSMQAKRDSKNVKPGTHNPASSRVVIRPPVAQAAPRDRHVKGLGKALDIVQVKEGYAQNYLFPKQLATLATPRNKKILEQDRVAAEEYYLKERKASVTIAEKLKGGSQAGKA